MKLGAGRGRHVRAVAKHVTGAATNQDGRESGERELSGLIARCGDLR